jgi:hypothetical protein
MEKVERGFVQKFGEILDIAVYSQGIFDIFAWEGCFLCKAGGRIFSRVTRGHKMRYYEEEL